LSAGADSRRDQGLNRTSEFILHSGIDPGPAGNSLQRWRPNMPDTILSGVRFFERLPLKAAIILLIFSHNRVSGGQHSMPLDTGWVMKTGDNPSWSSPDLDDGGWNPVRTGIPWEEAGYPGYDGYAWYRLRFTMPEDRRLKDDHGFLCLSLGFIDDADETYWNGKRIGATGVMPPDFRTAYYTPRRYRVPTEMIRWGQPNVITVRVYDGEGNGGLYRGPIELERPVPGDLTDITFTPRNSNGIFFSPGPLSVTLNIRNYSKMDLKPDAVFALVNDRVDSVRVLENIRNPLSIRGKSDFSKSVAFHPPQPGFYRVVCTLDDSVKKSMVFGYDPEKIITALTREPDFEEFWRRRKLELARVTPEFKVTRYDTSASEIEVYLVEMRSYGHVKIRGWYTVPRKPGPHPAILSVPGYTSSMRPFLNRKNAATFALNPRGHGNSKDDVDPKGAEYMFLGFDPEHPENYIYAGAYMDCIRAVDFLSSRPEIDASRIGVEGASQGGGLSFATAALDPRITFCAPDIPWLCDWVGYLETEHWGWNNYPILFKTFPGLTYGGINRFLSYFDTMNMAGWITCPVLMSVGLQDDVCPPRTSFATYNAVRSLKEYRVYPRGGHGVSREHEKLKDRWMAKLLGIEKTGL
jgi:cephalosporin-C deacetylase